MRRPDGDGHVHSMTFHIAGVVDAVVCGTMLHVGEFTLVRAPRAWWVREGGTPSRDLIATGGSGYGMG